MIRLENNENMYAVADTGSVINIIINGLTRISNVHTSFSIVETLTTSPMVVFPSNSLANFAWISDVKLVNTSSIPVTGITLYKGVGSPTTQITESITIQGDSSTSLTSYGTVTSSIESVKYITNIDTSTPNLTYIGRAILNSINSDPVWQIQLIDETLPIATIKYADGTKEFINIWNNRLAYTYS